MRAAWWVAVGAVVVASGFNGGCSSGTPQACVDLCACSSSSCNMTKEDECKQALAALNAFGQCGGADGGGSDGGGGGTDSGGGGSDGGGGGTACAELDACCAKLPDPTKTKCTDVVAKGEAYCQNSKSNYCSLDPAACTKLATCCGMLSGTDKDACDLQVSTYAGDVELCGTALTQYAGKCN